MSSREEQFELERKMINEMEELKKYRAERADFLQEKENFYTELTELRAIKIKYEELLQKIESDVAPTINGESKQEDTTTIDNVEESTAKIADKNEALEPKKLEDLTKSELLEICEKEQIEVNKALNKNEIINFINEERARKSDK